MSASISGFFPTWTAGAAGAADALGATDVPGFAAVLRYFFGRRRSTADGFLYRLFILDEGVEGDGAIGRDFHMGCGAANAHGGNWGVDLHIAGLCHLTGNEGERSFRETKETRVRFPFRIVYELVQDHPSVARKIEGATVAENDAGRPVRPGGNHVTLIDEIADLRLLGICGQVGLNDYGAGVLYPERARRRHDLSNWVRYGGGRAVLRKAHVRQRKACQQGQAGRQGYRTGAQDFPSRLWLHILGRTHRLGAAAACVVPVG